MHSAHATWLDDFVLWPASTDQGRWHAGWSVALVAAPTSLAVALFAALGEEALC